MGVVMSVDFSQVSEVPTSCGLSVNSETIKRSAHAP
jgi:hypothetical protein